MKAALFLNVMAWVMLTYAVFSILKLIAYRVLCDEWFMLDEVLWRAALRVPVIALTVSLVWIVVNW